MMQESQQCLPGFMTGYSHCIRHRNDPVQEGRHSTLSFSYVSVLLHCLRKTIELSDPVSTSEDDNLRSPGSGGGQRSNTSSALLSFPWGNHRGLPFRKCVQDVLFLVFFTCGVTGHFGVQTMWLSSSFGIDEKDESEPACSFYSLVVSPKAPDCRFQPLDTQANLRQRSGMPSSCRERVDVRSFG
jgi:hypothetical protein